MLATTPDAVMSLILFTHSELDSPESVVMRYLVVPPQTYVGWSWVPSQQQR